MSAEASDGPGATSALLREADAALALDLDDRAFARLLKLADLLARWAERLNLTGHRGPEAILRRLVLDALALERELPRAETLADLGSGAGFPGLPIAILRPETRVVLVEARERRHHFQRTAIRSLELENVEPYRGRIEDRPPEAWGPARGVVAQALAEPPQALTLALGWCAPGGWIALPGSAERPPEPEATPGAIDRVERRSYSVPVGGPARTLWIGHRPH